VYFTDLSVPPSGNTIFSYDWNFGDVLSATNTSTLSNPFHTYSDTGLYLISLKVITNAGCEQSITKTIHIAPKPTANFSNGISCQNDSTLFLNSSTSTAGYSITSINWNFGDPISLLANTSALQTPKHLFSNQGNYNVKLTATNNAGCKDSIISTIIVRAEISASFTNSPACAFSPIIFQDNSIVPPPSASHQRLWNFGTNTSSGLSVSKTYTSSGIYSVTLTVTGTNGCVSTTSKILNVFLPPVSSFSLPTLCLNDTSTITNSSTAQSGILSSSVWKFNNIQFSTAQTPTITSAIAATYTVGLVVTNSFGCIDSTTKLLTVLPLPVADFTTNPISNYYISSLITFTPTLTNATSYNWNISGIPTTTVQSPTTSFTNQGTYTVSLNITDQFGCKNSKTKTISINKRYLDMAILSVQTIKDNDGFMTTSANVANYGSVPITTFNMHYQISDGGNIKETWTGTLDPNSFYAYTFASKSASQVETSNNITCVEIETVNGTLDENTTNNYLCSALNLNEISVSNPIPNPTDGDITLPIVLNRDVDFTITIYNSMGQNQYQEITRKGATGLNFVTLPVSNFSRGCYIIKIIIDDKVFIQKFIKTDAK
jgi:PKD repeat protein